MLDDLSLKAVYDADIDDIANDFYNPVLSEAISFDRTSAYFTARALALYATGLERFGNKGNKYRLLISKDISEEDFNQLKKGYQLRKDILTGMIEDLDDKNLSLEEERKLSNLAYFIARGIIDVKIAFKTNGIFHDKTGIIKDAAGNTICFRGSNNETAAAVTVNSESFQLMCSWLDCNGFYSEGIKRTENDFEALWNNELDNVVVLPVDEIVEKEILKFNKGEIIVESILLEKNTVVLDYVGRLLLYVNTESISWLVNSAFYKMQIKSKVDVIDGNKIYFKSSLHYPDYKKISSILSKKILQKGYSFKETERLRQYIEERDLHIKSRAKLGIELKTDATRLDTRYIEFSRVVSQCMERKLRDQQMQDAFFMYAMNKSGNFSVPGSGKTTSALAVYAFMKNNGEAERVVVVGPKNSFGSWIDEFRFCFGKKEELRCFNIHDPRFKNTKEKKYALEYESGNCNLFLFNYESLGTYAEELSEIISNNTLLIFDEVHKVKRVNGTYAKSALQISEKSMHTIVMTGTPIPNTYADLYNMLHILYDSEYNEFFGFELGELYNPSESVIEEVNDKIQPFFCRTSKDELDVPKANEDIIIESTVKEAEQTLFEIVYNKYSNNKLALVIRLLQLESNPKLLLNAVEQSDFAGFLDTSGDIDDMDFIDATEEVKACIDKIDITSKKRKCIDLIKKLVVEDKTVVVWCIFTDTINSIHRILDDIGISSECIYGPVELEDRITIMERFKQKEFSVLITNPHTLAESVSLHSICHDAIYFEYSYNLVHLLQSKDRIHRLGLAPGQYTQYYFMHQIYDMEGNEVSLDAEIYGRLLMKEQCMLDAIDNHKLEPVYTTEDDLKAIFKNW